MSIDKNILGERGENVFFVAITELFNNEFIFHPTFLGQKQEYVDYFVEIKGNHKSIPYFFVQVKTTTQGYTKDNKFLKVQIPLEKLKQLYKIKAPTYFVGVNNATQESYILSVHKNHRKRISSMSVKYPMNIHNLLLLRDEVVQFWENNLIKPNNSRF